MIAGIIPGLTDSVAIAVLLPLLVFMPQTAAVVLMATIYASGTYAGAISAILVGIPGTATAVVTRIEGYPMAQKGLAGEALAGATFGSLIGGVFGAVVLLFMAPAVARLSLRFGPAEYFALSLFGLTVIAALAKKSVLKGLISGWIGLLLGTIGLDPIVGFARFTWRSPYLISGLEFSWIIVGFYALTQSYFLAEGTAVFQQYTAEMVNIPWRATWNKMMTLKPLMFVLCIIGVIVGIIPAAGATIGGWIGYTQARKMSNHPEMFGQGTLEGILGSEVTNNAVAGGAMIPTLTFGIPGSGSAAIILAGMIMIGLRPGPGLFDEQGDLVLTIMMGYLVANFVFVVLAVYAMKYFLKVLSLPPSIWPSLIIVIGLFATYVGQGSMFGGWFAIGLSIAGDRKSTRLNSSHS
jgi:putative tricarboxylic transport membrane protein